MTHEPCRGGDEALLCVSGDYSEVACFDPKTLVLSHGIPTPQDNQRVCTIPAEDGREEDLVVVGEADLDFDLLVYSPYSVDPPIRKLSFSDDTDISYVRPRFVVARCQSSRSQGHGASVWDVNSGEKVMDLKGASKQLHTTAITTTLTTRQQEEVWSPQRGDGFVFLGNRKDPAIYHYDLGRSERSDEVVKKFEGHEISGLSYSTEKNLLFSSSESLFCSSAIIDRTLRIWSVQDATCLEKLPLLNSSTSLLHDPKKRLIFCGTMGGIIEVWDYRQTRKRVRKIDHPTLKKNFHISELVQIDDETYASIGDDPFVVSWTDRGKVRAVGEAKGFLNSGMCIVGERQPSYSVSAPAEEELDRRLREQFDVQLVRRAEAAAAFEELMQEEDSAKPSRKKNRRNKSKKKGKRRRGGRRRKKGRGRKASDKKVVVAPTSSHVPPPPPAAAHQDLPSTASKLTERIVKKPKSRSEKRTVRSPIEAMLSGEKDVDAGVETGESKTPEKPSIPEDKSACYFAVEAAEAETRPPAASVQVTPRVCEEGIAEPIEGTASSPQVNDVGVKRSIEQVSLLPGTLPLAFKDGGHAILKIQNWAEEVDARRTEIALHHSRVALLLSEIKRLENAMKIVEIRRGDMLQKAKEKRASEDDRACVVCLEAAKSILLLPCRHLCLCEGCSKGVETCPLCRGKIENKIPVFV